MILVGKFGEQQGNKIQLLHSGGFTWVRFGVVPKINRNKIHAVQGLAIDGELQFLCFCRLRNRYSFKTEYQLPGSNNCNDKLC